VGWRVFFHREAGPPSGVYGDAVVLRHARVLERASARMQVGQPFLVGPDGTVDVRINRWFVSDEIRDLSRSTWEKYAYNLGVWLSFLSAYGCLWDEADAGVQEAFKFWRVLDERNERLVSLGTYEHDLIAIRLFYVWADGEYGVGNPIRMRRSRGRRRGGTFTERPETAPKAVRDQDVKWFAPAGYARYRDVGLLGLTVDGDDDPSFRGRNSQRDGAFADGLYGTGLRLREWGSVLLMELPPDDRNRADHGGRHAPLPEPGFPATAPARLRAATGQLATGARVRARARPRARTRGRGAGPEPVTAPWSVDDAQEAQAVDQADPEH
jgi:integrase